MSGVMKSLLDEQEKDLCPSFLVLNVRSLKTNIIRKQAQRKWHRSARRQRNIAKNRMAEAYC